MWSVGLTYSIGNQTTRSLPFQVSQFNMKGLDPGSPFIGPSSFGLSSIGPSMFGLARLAQHVWT